MEVGIKADAGIRDEMTKLELWFVCNCLAGIVRGGTRGTTTDTHRHPNYCASYYFSAILHMIRLI